MSRVLTPKHYHQLVKVLDFAKLRHTVIFHRSAAFVDCRDVVRVSPYPVFQGVRTVYVKNCSTEFLHMCMWSHVFPKVKSFVTDGYYFGLWLEHRFPEAQIMQTNDIDCYLDKHVGVEVVK